MQVQDRREVSERREDAGIFMTCFFVLYNSLFLKKKFENEKEKRVAEMVFKTKVFSMGSLADGHIDRLAKNLNDNNNNQKDD